MAITLKDLGISSIWEDAETVDNKEELKDKEIIVYDWRFVPSKFNPDQEYVFLKFKIAGVPDDNVYKVSFGAQVIVDTFKVIESKDQEIINKIKEEGLKVKLVKKTSKKGTLYWAIE